MSRDAFVCFPRVSSPSARLGLASGRAFSARELASVSPVHPWTGDT